MGSEFLFLISMSLSILMQPQDNSTSWATPAGVAQDVLLSDVCVEMECNIDWKNTSGSNYYCSLGLL